MKWKTVFILAGTIAVAAAIVFLTLSGSGNGRATAEVAPTQPGAPAPDPVVPAAPAANREPRVFAPFEKARTSARAIKLPRAPDFTDEASLMAKLRELSGSNPALSLKLAKEGIEKFKETPDAPEREWIVVKSLVNMNRNEEARAEAERMIQKYPGTSWANDIHRHLFVNPPTDPTERGFGKKTELE